MTPPLLVTHYEQFLGKIKRGWSSTDPSQGLPRFQAIECQGETFPDISFYVTLGLSNYPLDSAVSQDVIRHELLFAAPTSVGPQHIPSLLERLGSEAIRNKQAYLRGQTLHLQRPLFSNSRLTSLYFALPVFLSDDFATTTLSDGSSVAMVWVIPITDQELRFIHHNGWKMFEYELQAADPNLFDLNRESAVS